MLRDNHQFNESIKSNSAFLDELRQKMPEFFTASKYDEESNEVETGFFDNEKFQQALKEHNIDELSSGYRLDFIGKNYAKKQAGERPTTVIVPDHDHNQKDENKNSKNLFFTGDNLEVLRHLQQNYTNSVDFIYIDPPYNTGSDGFVYPDNFEYSDNQLKDMFALNDDELKRLKSIQGKSTHSAWLTFMYPRLYLAKKVLKDTGVIFVSIDDNEQANLKLLMDEVFGEGSFVADFIITRSEGGGLAKQAIIGHDYLLVYSKNINKFKPLGRPKDIRGKIVELDGEEYWIETDWLRKEFGKYGTLLYENIVEFKGQAKKDEIDKGISEGKYVLLEKENKHIVGRYRKVSDDTSKFYTILKHLNKNGVADLEKVNLVEIFSYPKPVSLIKEIVKGINNKQAIIFDFFAGSSTTADAVMQLNAEDGGNRQYIMCTLPEPTFTVNSDGKEIPTKGGKPAYKAGYKSIDEISRERIIRAANKIKEENPLLTETQDFGFKHYRVVPPTQDILEKIDYDDQLQLDLFDDMIDAFSSEKLGVAGNADGFDTILHTYLAKDNYQFDVPLQMIDFAGIQLPYVNNQRIYLIAKNWQAENTRALVNAIGKNELLVQTIVVYGYTLEMESLRELEIALNQLEIKVNLQVRY